jgi:hypothetical protein
VNKAEIYERVSAIPQIRGIDLGWPASLPKIVPQTDPMLHAIACMVAIYPEDEDWPDLDVALPGLLQQMGDDCHTLAGIARQLFPAERAPKGESRLTMLEMEDPDPPPDKDGQEYYYDEHGVERSVPEPEGEGP